MMKIFFALFYAALFLCSSNAISATSAWQENESNGAKTRLIGSFYQDQNGETKLIAGLEFKIASGWKIYGQGSDGIGLPPSFDFANSKNYLRNQITWPKAQEYKEKIGNEIYKYSAYHDDVILPITIDVEKKDAAVDLTLKLSYGLCKDVCIPVNETFSLKIETQKDEKVLQLIQNFYPEKISEISQNSATNISEIKQIERRAPSLIYWIMLAIIGGAILNIMPCVLPVLSIKLLSVIDHSNAKTSRIRFAFFSTICGIILCFFILAFAAAALKLLGNSLGWGLQFQNPYFLITLSIILIFFSANLLGIFEISFDQFFANFLNKKITDFDGKKNIFIPNFLSGILAVLLATPCSAPVLGSAISFALTQEISTIFLIFCAIGIGFAAPYIALLAAPQLVYLLPKPGMWMIKIKKLMALLLAITAAWLLYILMHNIGLIPTLAVTISLLLLLISFEIRSKFIKFFSIILLIAVAFGAPLVATKEISQTEKPTQDIWIKFDEKQLYQLVMQNKVVVIDITADWCITCKINKLTVLNSAEIVEKLHGENIVAMRADITKPDEEVMNFMHKHNRFAIPFNAVYGANAKSGKLASELLTKKELLELIEKSQ